MTLEAGQVSPPQSFTVKNVGTREWSSSGPTPVRLGTYQPRDRSSAFYDPNSWIIPSRADTLDQTTVAPGQNGTFTFTVRAPGATGLFHEHFAPVAEQGGWMDDGPWGNVFLQYQVVGRVAPSVTRIDVSPDVVRSGEKVSVAATATDNVAVDKFAFRVGNQSAEQPVPYPPPYSSATNAAAAEQLSTQGLGAGVHSVYATVTDKVGQTGFATTEIVVEEPGDSGGGGGGGQKPFPVPNFKLEYHSLLFPDEPYRQVDRFTILPAASNSTATVDCVRGCGLHTPVREERKHEITFGARQLKGKLRLDPGDLVEAQVEKGNYARVRRYDWNNRVVKAYCMQRKDKDSKFKKSPCSRGQ